MLEPPGQHLNGDLLEPLSIDLTRFGWVAAEEPTLEHLERGHRETLTARIDLAGLFGLVRPFVSCTSIQEHRNHEEVD